MKITVIGQWGAYPKVCEATSGYLLQEDGFNLLVDCGSGVISNIQKYIKVEDINAVVISHYHHDHIADVGILQYARLIKSMMDKSLKSIPIYGHCYDQKGFQSLTKEPYTTGLCYKENENVNIGPFNIKFFKAKHSVTSFAMKITSKDKSVFYTGDTAYVTEFEQDAKNVDLLISECSLYANQDGSAVGHMNSNDVGTLAKKAEVKEVLLTHLPQYGDLDLLLKEARQIYKGKICLASAGMIL